MKSSPKSFSVLVLANAVVAMMMVMTTATLMMMSTVVDVVDGFVPPCTTTTTVTSRTTHAATRLWEQKNGILGAIGNFFEELDAFVDDATSRRLGAGSAFYGKRKSSFYGKEDKGRKANKDTPSPLEDYQGPAKAGYFQWMQDEETGEMKPVTRMKQKNIERNPNYWDKVFGDDDKNSD